MNYKIIYFFIYYKFFKYDNGNKNKLFKIIIRWGLGIGDWGLGIGDWGLGGIPNTQSPIPNP